MDHLKIYKQLYKAILGAVSCFENENSPSAFVQLGILLETLKCLIEKLEGSEECPECKEEEELEKTKKDFEKCKEFLEFLKAQIDSNSK